MANVSWFAMFQASQSGFCASTVMSLFCFCWSLPLWWINTSITKHPNFVEISIISVPSVEDDTHLSAALLVLQKSQHVIYPKKGLHLKKIASSKFMAPLEAFTIWACFKIWDLLWPTEIQWCFYVFLLKVIISMTPFLFPHLGHSQIHPSSFCSDSTAWLQPKVLKIVPLPLFSPL